MNDKTKDQQASAKSPKQFQYQAQSQRRKMQYSWLPDWNQKFIDHKVYAFLDVVSHWLPDETRIVNYAVSRKWLNGDSKYDQKWKKVDKNGDTILTESQRVFIQETRQQNKSEIKRSIQGLILGSFVFLLKAWTSDFESSIESLWMRLIFPGAILIGSVLCFYVEHNMERLQLWQPYIVLTMAQLIITEFAILRSPDMLQFNEATIAITSFITYQSASLIHSDTRNSAALAASCHFFPQLYAFARAFMQYGNLNIELLVFAFVATIHSLKVINFTMSITDLFLQQYQENKELEQGSYLKVMNNLQDGILCLSHKPDARDAPPTVIFANEKMKELVGLKADTNAPSATGQPVNSSSEASNASHQEHLAGEASGNQVGNRNFEQNPSGDVSTLGLAIFKNYFSQFNLLTQENEKKFRYKLSQANNQNGNGNPHMPYSSSEDEEYGSETAYEDIDMWSFIFVNSKEAFEKNQKKIFVFRHTKHLIYFQIRVSFEQLGLGSQDPKVQEKESSFCGHSLQIMINDFSRIKELEEKESAILRMFFTSLAHEYKTPLNTILPITKCLEDYVTDPQGILMLRTISNSAIHLENVVNDTLDVSKMQDGSLKIEIDQFNIIKCLKEVYDIMRFQVDSKGLIFEFYTQQGFNPIVFSDKKRYKQILFNLVGNALKFTNTGFVRVRIHAQGKMIITEVIDSGQGIRQKQLGQLFKFFAEIDAPQHQANSNGMGLGLTVARLISMQLGGNVWVDSTLSKGSIFTYSIRNSNDPNGDLSSQGLGSSSCLDEIDQVVFKKLNFNVEVMKGFKPSDIEVTDLNDEHSPIRVPTLLKASFTNIPSSAEDDEGKGVGSTKSLHQDFMEVQSGSDNEIEKLTSSLMSPTQKQSRQFTFADREEGRHRGSSTGLSPGSQTASPASFPVNPMKEIHQKNRQKMKPPKIEVHCFSEQENKIGKQLEGEIDRDLTIMDSSSLYSNLVTNAAKPIRRQHSARQKSRFRPDTTVTTSDYEEEKEVNSMQSPCLSYSDAGLPEKPKEGIKKKVMQNPPLKKSSFASGKAAQSQVFSDRGAVEDEDDSPESRIVTKYSKKKEEKPKAKKKEKPPPAAVFKPSGVFRIRHKNVQEGAKSGQVAVLEESNLLEEQKLQREGSMTRRMASTKKLAVVSEFEGGIEVQEGPGGATMKTICINNLTDTLNSDVSRNVQKLVQELNLKPGLLLGIQQPQNNFIQTEAGSQNTEMSKMGLPYQDLTKLSTLPKQDDFDTDNPINRTLKKLKDTIKRQTQTPIDTFTHWQWIQHQRVLIVDDNCYNLFVLEILLKKMKNRQVIISKAQNGREAISVFQEVMLINEINHTLPTYTPGEDDQSTRMRPSFAHQRSFDPTLDFNSNSPQPQHELQSLPKIRNNDLASTTMQAVNISEFFNVKKQTDVILMDLNMPLMDGFEATKIIRGLQKQAKLELKIVAISAMSQQLFKQTPGFELFDQFVEKPVSLDKLQQIFDHSCDQ